MLLINEVNRVYAPSFNELSVAKIWPEIKKCDHIMEYMPDYNEDQQPERDFLLNIMNTVYPRSVFKIIQAAYSKRKPEEDKEGKDLIEITPQMKQIIDNVIQYKSKFIANNKYSDTRPSNCTAQGEINI